MLDDVVGLVMVQVISNLGSNDFTPTTVVRPIAVSMGLGVVVVLVCILIAKPLTTWFNHIDGGKRGGLLTKVLGGTYAPVIIHTMLLLGLVTGATYAGTSNLFAAYLAGASISWWDSEYLEATLPNSTASTNKRSASQTQSLDEPPAIAASSEAVDEIHSTSNLNISRTDPPKSGVNTFEQFYGPVLHRVLKPLFFASIGLAIPITELFSGPIVWRGIIYTILMLFGKLVTGFWLVRFSGPIFPTFSFWSNIKDKVTTRKAAKSKKGKMKYQKEEATTTGQTEGLRPNDNIQLQDISQPTPDRPNIPQPSTRANEGRKRAGKVKCINPPLSLYPAAMLGTAMTARGEIGFLIASLAETTGVFSSATPSTTSESSEIYLITTWAILLCTIIGPLSVGTLVKRVRRLENNLAAKGDNEREQGPLGIWGVC
jgi:Kef-type K+ transport system membrane component KefB